ncbi:hypothetical protein BD779DRAFT_1210034 [Infundibulicybe gibba]|nr:hypothetical protein BD779DRAFT_1210034 [Infundibulicybe gibba]
MDIFGTIASAIDLAGKLVVYFQAVKGAKEDRLKFLLEVSTLGALLEVLQSRLGDTDADGGGGKISNKLVKAGIGGPLRACYDALKSTVEGLERLVSGVGTGRSSSLAELMRDLRWPFHQEDVRATLDKIERLKSLVSLALQTSLLNFIEKARNELAVVGLNVEEIRSIIASLEASQRAHTKQIESLQGDLISLGATLQGAADGITAMQNSVAAIDRNQQEQERRAIISWLSAPEFDQKRITAFEKRAPGTGEWFLRHPKFAAWRRGEFNVLWCPGNPGAGKSVMTSVVIHHLQEGITEDTAVVFIYFEYTNKDDHTMRRLVEAILSQLVQRGMSISGAKSLQKYI